MERTIKLLKGLILGFLFIFSATSCSKTALNTVLLEGKWKTREIAVQEYENNKLVEAGTFQCIEFYMIFDLNADGTGELKVYDGGDISRTPIDWQVKGNKFMLFDTETRYFDIVSLDSGSMALKYTNEEIDEDERYKQILTLYFDKMD